MTLRLKIFVCLEFNNPHWELPIVTSNNIEQALLAWLIYPSSVESGLPDEIVEIIAHTLVEQTLVTFPIRERAKNISFVSTEQFIEVTRAFNADYFDWSQRGQVIFLSAKGYPSPAITKSELQIDLTDAGIKKLMSFGIIGLVLPGVDGDVAGIYSFSTGLLNNLLDTIREECMRLDFPFLIINEQEMADALAGQ